jgi:integrase/recombinase XerD
MLNQFAQYLQEDNKSENTIKGYILDIKGYLSWLNNNETILIRENILNFKKYLS